MDLGDRYAFFQNWVAKGTPVVFWISAFTYPNGFTTSLLQKFSRKPNAPSIDNLQFEFIPVNPNAKNVNEAPRDGSYVRGLYLEGAKWNSEKGCLMEPEVMELATLMPVIHFKPKQKTGKVV